MYDLILDLAAALFGLVGLVYLARAYFTPELRDQPFDTSLEKAIGHTGTFLVFLAFSVLMLLVGLYFARKTVRLMRNRAYLEADESPFNPNR